MSLSIIPRYWVLFQALLVVISCENGAGLFTLHGVRQYGVDFQDIAKEFNLNYSNLSVSLDCGNQLQELYRSHQDVLLKMADAWSKFPYSGVLYGSRNDYGNYDECISIKVQPEKGDAILGKQCTYGLIIPDITLTNTTEMIEKGWTLSYCVPHLCSADDLNNITSLPLFNEQVCSTQETDSEVDAGAIVTLVVFALIILLMVLSTIYDSWFYQNKEKGIFILTAFSVHANSRRLLTFVKHSKEQILCFHGIKFISMWWIIAGHNVVSWLTYPITNDQFRTDWQHELYSIYLLTAHLAVDSFFYISGFLLAYLYFRNPVSKKSVLTQAKAVPSMILHRYLRLTPSVLMTFLFSTYVLKYMGDGPLFGYALHGDLTNICKNNWWTVFLYIQNYYKGGTELCITSLWYVSADMQLFLVAPLIIIPVAILHKRSFKIAMAVLGVLNMLFVGLPILTKLVWKDYDPELNEYDAHSRLIDYFIGVTMGLAFRQPSFRDFKIKRRTNLLTWFIVLAGMAGILIVLQEINMSYGYLAKSLCYSFVRPLWCIGLSWITWACFTGHGGFINWLLSNKFMQLGGKLTYCVYLVHGTLVIYYTLLGKSRRTFTDLNVFYDFSGHFIISLVLATFWTLAFELPMITIERLIFGRPVQKKAPKTPPNPDKTQETIK